MSEFSTVLSRFVKEKDVNVYRLAKYCGYDRANLYKVMRGERKPPSLEVLNLLCEYMHLSPDRKSTRLNSSHKTESRMPSSA